ncbi:ankyrin repeat domain-containing protein [Piscinibacter sakaiensis]|uniref:Ankyrin repeat domain protein n=1 Tax=Piscinibacter sakaiensis TaxID=1547922 RepID=A0A0K8NWG1_PISS1|nr:ankyrin repeat domain-containing protein [Piscinibacter sakaiensis]GAP34711.1 ankyrin repeat domain protein [Piscinibacter sakaiensis]
MKHVKFLLQLLVASLLLSLQPARADGVEDLLVAINRDDRGGVRRLLERGVDPNALDAKGRNGLSFALLNDSLAAAEVLLADPKVDVNRLNAAGESPLMIAALRGNLDWCKRLVARGAKVNHDGWSALHYAASGPNAAIVDWLIGLGANVEGRSPNGTTPLMMAARYGPEDAVDRLLAARAEIRATNEQDLNAVDFARLGGRESLMRRLARLLPAQ